MAIYVCGDSTAASYAEERAPIMGWGQLLGEYTGGIPVINAALGGRSTKSFLSEGHLVKIEATLEPGDILLIQFAHNDTSDLVWRHTDAWTSYMDNLSIFVDTARLRGATPVLMTPICRRYFSEGALLPSHGEYPDAVRTLAIKKNVPLIDIYLMSAQKLAEMGDEASRKLYMHVEPGVYPDYPDGQADDTHTRRAGAAFYAQMTADALRALNLIV